MPIPKSRCGKISLLFRKSPFLFFDTVAENIAFGRDFSEEEIHEAARQAHAEEFIQHLPQGYETRCWKQEKIFQEDSSSVWPSPAP